MAVAKRDGEGRGTDLVCQAGPADREVVDRVAQGFLAYRPCQVVGWEHRASALEVDELVVAAPVELRHDRVQRARLAQLAVGALQVLLQDVRIGRARVDVVPEVLVPRLLRVPPCRWLDRHDHRTKLFEIGQREGLVDQPLVLGTLQSVQPETSVRPQLPVILGTQLTSRVPQFRRGSSRTSRSWWRW